MNRVFGTAMALVLLGGTTPSAARAQDILRAVGESYPTNLTMLTEAAQSAVNEMLLNFSPPPGVTVLVEAEAEHEARWMLENLLLARLSERGHAAYLKGKAEEEAGEDSVAAAEAVPAGGAEYVLRFRVAECSLTYPHSYKKSPLGSRTVQRLASVSVYGTLLRGSREEVVWVGRGDAERLDLVPASKLPLLEGRNYPFTKPALETHGLGDYAEPALVTGIVAGLIYLFYTNQN